jgi:MTH538 TIR-like domain (DUF1863).
VPEQLRPIFRDRLELRAGVSLAKAIREALVQSDALIVLCSPRARISPWVNREICEFHAAERSRPTFAFILEGNPLANPEDPQGCFPNALFETSIATPSDLASDARADGDGWNLALLKLIAGLARVPLDDLVRRDHQRKIRQLQWLVAGSAALALVFAGLGTAVYLQRQEAIRQRNLALNVRDRAQEMNTFFITDLRTKLRALGRLDLLDEATKRVLAYQQALPAELANDPAVLRARAIAMDYVGQMAMARGQSAEAISRLTESRSAWRKLLDQNHSDAAAWQGHIISCKMLGEAFESAEQLAAALKVYDDAIGSFAAFRGKTAEGVAKHERLRSLLLTARGNVRYRLGDAEGALRDLDDSASYAKDAVETTPTDKAAWQQAVKAFGALADYYREIGDLKSAFIQAQEAVEDAEALTSLDTDDVDGWSLLADATGSRLMVEAMRNEWDNAVQTGNAQLDLRKRIFERDPQNPTAEGYLAAAHDDLGFALEHGGKRRESNDEFGEAIRIYVGLVRRYPSRVGWRRDLALVLKRRGDLAFGVEGWDLALHDYDQCLNLRRALATEAPENVNAQAELANILIARGEVLWKKANISGARDAFAEALKVLRAPHVPENHPDIAKLRRSAQAALDDLERQTHSPDAQKK